MRRIPNALTPRSEHGRMWGLDRWAYFSGQFCFCLSHTYTNTNRPVDNWHGSLLVWQKGFTINTMASPWCHHAHSQCSQLTPCEWKSRYSFCKEYCCGINCWYIHNQPLDFICDLVKGWEWPRIVHRVDDNNNSIALAQHTTYQQCYSECVFPTFPLSFQSLDLTSGGAVLLNRWGKNSEVVIANILALLRSPLNKTLGLEHCCGHA